MYSEIPPFRVPGAEIRVNVCGAALQGGRAARADIGARQPAEPLHSHAGRVQNKQFRIKLILFYICQGDSGSAYVLARGRRSKAKYTLVGLHAASIGLCKS